MKLWITLEGRDADVEFRTDGDVVRILVDGRELEADFHPLPDGEVYSLLVNGRSHEVRIAPNPGGGLDVSVHGDVLPVEVRRPIERLIKSMTRAAVAGGETIAAPMPGVVVAFRVKAGDLVAPGQAVVVVEAMKMQNELAARRGGVVSEILVAERAPVAAGQPLVRLKAAP